jgi:hypothetical protein
LSQRAVEHESSSLARGCLSVGTENFTATGVPKIATSSGEICCYEWECIKSPLNRSNNNKFKYINTYLNVLLRKTSCVQLVISAPSEWGYVPRFSKA